MARGSLVEVVARTLYACEKNRADHTDKVMGLSRSTMEPWEEVKEIYLADAQAVLHAMRDPTQDMVIAAERQHGLLEGLKYEEGWRTMIDEAMRPI